MISDSNIEACLDWLVKNAVPAAKARADRLYLEQWLKSQKAILMKKSGEETVAAQEREALANPEYLKTLEQYRYAVAEDERLRFLTAAAEVKVEVWRTENANARAQGKIQ